MTIETRLKALNDVVSRLHPSDFPDVVFVESTDTEHFSVSERYFGRTESGKFTGTNRTKTFESSDSLESILSHYNGQTTVFIGGVDE